MLTALDYGNAAAYLTAAIPNFQTAFLNGLDTEDGNLSWSRVTYYSILRDSATSPPSPATPTSRLTGAAGNGGCAFVGWHGPRPVAFPCTSGWNFDQPIIT